MANSSVQLTQCTHNSQIVMSDNNEGHYIPVQHNQVSSQLQLAEYCSDTVCATADIW